MYPIINRFKILKLKDINRNLSQRCSLLEQWISVYDSDIHVPGKYHRDFYAQHLKHKEELENLRLVIIQNGELILKLKSQE